jgi:putative flippase GtrA
MKSFFKQIMTFIPKLWSSNFIRFLFIGGINTILGFVLTIILRESFFSSSAKWMVLGFIEFDLANSVMYVMLFPISYTLQALVTFRTRWSLKRLIRYPISSIPNYALNQVFIFLFETLWSFSVVVSYGLSAILPIPIMFIIIKLLVVEKKSKSTI